MGAMMVLAPGELSGATGSSMFDRRFPQRAGIPCVSARATMLLEIQRLLRFNGCWAALAPHWLFSRHRVEALMSAAPGRAGDGVGACRTQRRRSTPAGFCRTDMGPWSLSRCRFRLERSQTLCLGEGCRAERSEPRVIQIALAQSFVYQESNQEDVYASAVGLCRDSNMMQSRTSSNADF